MSEGTMEIQVYRQQYGVGQGGFHFQELVFDAEAAQPTFFRFAYDCGGQSAQSNKTLNWCIDHAMNGCEPEKLQAVYLSHFEQDHVNGVFALCLRADVERIYVPYITPRQALQVAARDAALGVEWSVGQANFLNNVFDLASGGQTLLGVPVTKIRPGDGPPSGNDVRDDRPDLLPPAGDRVRTKPVTGAEAADSERTIMSVRSSPAPQAHGNAPAPVWTEVWELVHWSYACEQALTTCIFTEIAKVSRYVQCMEPALQTGATDAQRESALQWIGKHYQELAWAYRTAIQLHNQDREQRNLLKIVDNHNVVSLCLYSGSYVIPDSSIDATYNCSPAFNFHPRVASRISWLATGDAMLKLQDVWDGFAQHYGHDRLERVMTLLIPHHGADASESKNFNPKLLESCDNCVISSGVHSGKRHPHRRVVQAILEARKNLHCVNENQPLGFSEALRFRFHLQSVGSATL